MTRDDAIRKLQSLFHLANDGGATDGEMTAAWAAARRLMRQYHIDEAEATPPDAAAPDICIVVLPGGVAHWEQALSDAVAMLTGVRGRIINGKYRKCCYIGSKSDTSIAAAFYRVLRQSLHRACRAAQVPGLCRRSLRRRWHTAFATGYALAVVTRASQRDPDESPSGAATAGSEATYALAIRSKLSAADAWLAGRCQPAKPARRKPIRNSEMLHRGWRAGQCVDLSFTRSLEA